MFVQKSQPLLQNFPNFNGKISELLLWLMDIQLYVPVFEFRRHCPLSTKMKEEGEGTIGRNKDTVEKQQRKNATSCCGGRRGGNLLRITFLYTILLMVHHKVFSVDHCHVINGHVIQYSTIAKSCIRHGRHVHLAHVSRRVRRDTRANARASQHPYDGIE